MTQKKHPPPWIFAVLCLPMGTFWGFITTAMPFLLRKQGIAVEQIASISALTGIAQIVYVVWSPIADMIFTRRMWVLLLSLVSAAMLFVAVMLPVPQYLTLYAALLIVGNAVNTSTSIASGGLMAVLTHETLQGKAGGWYQAGNLGGGALAGGICIWLSTRVPDWQLATAAAAMVFVPSLAVLLIEEAPRDLSPNLALFTTMFHNLRDLMKQRATWLGFLFFLSPLGAAALGTLFSGVGVDYHASAKVVVLVTGVGGAICTALGSVLGGHLCDHMDRRHAYILSGGLSALVSGAMLFAHTSPLVFAVGASAYLVIAGFSYAAYNALSLELTARDACTGGTRFSLFGAAANGPVAYMTWLDGQGHKLWGVRGLLGVDTVGSVVGVAGMLVIMYWMFRRSPAAATQPASSFISS